jgi:hypothetical protein
LFDAVRGIYRASDKRFDRRRGKIPATPVALIVLALSLCPRVSSGQQLEPRSLTNVPVGTNFALLGYSYSAGDILLDPAVPITDLNANLHTIVGAYVRAIDFLGLSSKVDAIVPFAGGDWTGAVSGRDSSTSRTGFGDPRVRLSVNFAGAPALRAADYGGYRQHTIAGASLQVTAPLGQYDPSKLINLGSNRWTFRAQVGASRATGDWILEGYASGWFFTENPDFWGGNKLRQQPLGALKVHVIHTLPRRRSWLALDAGYAIGGRTELNGQKKDTRISTFRFGATLVMPLTSRHTLKLTGMTGVRHERGPDFDAVAMTYQYRWGV